MFDSPVGHFGPTLTVSLPAGVTAETGLEVLTHAVEAYIGRFYNTREI